MTGISDWARRIFEKIEAEGNMTRYIKTYGKRRYVDDTVIMLDHDCGRVTARMVRQLIIDGGYL